MHGYQEAYFDIAVSQYRISFLHCAPLTFSSFGALLLPSPTPKSRAFLWSFSSVSRTREKYTLSTWVKHNLAYKDHQLRDWAVMMSGINSPNCNYGQSMSISEENSAINWLNWIRVTTGTEKSEMSKWASLKLNIFWQLLLTQAILVL